VSDTKNILMVVADSLRYDYISHFSDDKYNTQNIDGFLNESSYSGVVVSQSPWTLPSHASIFTGEYPWEHGATQRSLMLEEDDTLPNYLSDQGYETVCFSDNPFLRSHSGLVTGFDEVRGKMSGDTLTDSLVSKLEKFLSGRSGVLAGSLTSLGDWLHHRSFESNSEEYLQSAAEFLDSEDDSFAFLNLMDVHEPLYPPERYLDKHDAPDPSAVDQQPGEVSDRRAEALESLYTATLDYLDDIFGEFMDELESRSLRSDTTIILCSDHGQLIGEDRLYGHQFSAEEMLVRVPLIVDPAQERENLEFCELRDLNPFVRSEALGRVYEPSSARGMGGYDFPEMMAPRIPEGSWQDLYRRLTYAEDEGEDIAVLAESEDGTVEEVENMPAEVRNLLEVSWELGGSEDGEKSEQVMRNLRDLGYR